MRWRRLTINSRLSCAVCAPSTLKKLKSVNLSKRILPALKVRHLRRSHLRLAWPRLPCDLGLQCQWHPQLRLPRPPVLRLPPTRRPINPHYLGLRLLLGLLRLPAALLLVLPLLGRILLPLSMAAVLPRKCSDPNPPMRRKSVFTNINAGSPPLLLLI
jgi:hypothetical protein